MLTGELRSQINAIWDSFWSGGISNPLEVMEQITYLLFIRRLDDAHTLEESKALMLKKPMVNRTVERYIAQHGDELKINGYRLLKGPSLKKFKDLVHVTLVNEGNKAPILGVFSFRAVLNLAMLLTESERAKFIRSRLLDIVMDVLAEKTGGHTSCK